MVGKHMAQTLSTASSPGGTCYTPLVPTVTTTPTWATPAAGNPASTFCVANTPGAIPHPLSAFMQTPPGAYYNLPLPDITETTSTCGDTRVIYATPIQLCATSKRSAPLEGLCAPPGSPESPVTRVVGRHMLLGTFYFEEALDDDPTEDHQELGWNDAAVTFDTVTTIAQPCRTWPHRERFRTATREPGKTRAVRKRGP